MIMISRPNADGTERIIKKFDSLESFCEYFENVKEPSDQEELADGCWNCLEFNWDREACMVGWNNLDESYYNPDTDDRELTDYCENHTTDPDADPECLIYRGNEP